MAPPQHPDTSCRVCGGRGGAGRGAAPHSRSAWRTSSPCPLSGRGQVVRCRTHARTPFPPPRFPFAPLRSCDVRTTRESGQAPAIGAHLLAASRAARRRWRVAYHPRAYFCLPERRGGRLPASARTRRHAWSSALRGGGAAAARARRRAGARNLPPRHTERAGAPNPGAPGRRYAGKAGPRGSAPLLFGAARAPPRPPATAALVLADKQGTSVRRRQGGDPPAGLLTSGCPPPPPTAAAPQRHPGGRRAVAARDRVPASGSGPGAAGAAVAGRRGGAGRPRPAQDGRGRVGDGRSFSMISCASSWPAGRRRKGGQPPPPAAPADIAACWSDLGGALGVAGTARRRRPPAAWDFCISACCCCSARAGGPAGSSCAGPHGD